MMNQKHNKVAKLLIEYIDSISTERIVSIVGKSLYEKGVIQPSVQLGNTNSKEQLKKEIESNNEYVDIKLITQGTISASNLIYKEIEKYKKKKTLYSCLLLLFLSLFFLKNQIYSIGTWDSCIILVSCLVLAFFYFIEDKHLTSYETEFRRLLFLAEKIRISNIISDPSEKMMLFDNISIEQAIVNTQPIKTQINIREQKGHINMKSND